MAETVTLDQANEYVDEYILHSESWDEADEKHRQKALNNAEQVLYRYFSRSYNLDDPTAWLPWKAVVEQAIWMLRMNDAVLQAEQGVMQVSADGVSVLTRGIAADSIAPEAKRIIAEDGKAGGRTAWTVI